MHWIIDPIKSFCPGESGTVDNLLIPTGPNGKPFEDTVLWKAGKRAFDIIHKLCGDEAETKNGLEQIILTNAEELRKFYNGMIEELNSYITEGWLQITDEGTGKLFTELEPLTSASNKYGAIYKIESAVWNLDTIIEALALKGGADNIPYEREFVAAIFTLVHVDDSALSHIHSDCHQPDAHSWATQWFEKLDNFDRTIQAMQARQDLIHREKSQVMNQSRHARRNEAVKLVTSDWSEHKSEFRSAEKAGYFYADWLKKQGFEYEPRTVTGWIREYAKKNNIILR